jgi:hypothetical protein
VALPPLAVLTTRLTVAECVRDPLVPVIVSAYVPAVVLVAVVTFNVELPEPLTEGGLNEPLAPLGNPLTLKLTVPLKPSTGLTVAV